MDYPKVFIVILNWNGYKDTVEGVESLQQISYPNFEILIVDNGSTDNSEEKLKRKFPDLKILQAGSNLGYAGGNNVGIRFALSQCAELILILNNDVVVDEEFLNNLVSELESNKHYGLAGPCSYYLDKPNIVWANGVSINIDNYTHTPFSLLGSNRGLNPTEKTKVVDGITGNCMLVRRKVFKDIGLFDERFYLLHEESDFCLRARKAGWKIISVANAKVWHKVSASLGKISDRVTYYHSRNSLLCYNKHAELTVRLGAFLHSFSILLKNIFLKKKLDAETRGILDFYRGRFGKCPY